MSNKLTSVKIAESRTILTVPLEEGQSIERTREVSKQLAESRDLHAKMFSPLIELLDDYDAVVEHDIVECTTFNDDILSDRIALNCMIEEDILGGETINSKDVPWDACQLIGSAEVISRDT